MGFFVLGNFFWLGVALKEDEDLKVKKQLYLEEEIERRVQAILQKDYEDELRKIIQEERT